MKTIKILSAALFFGASMFLAAPNASADCYNPGTGGRLIYLGGNVTITEQYAEAGHTSELWLYDRYGNPINLSAVTGITPFIMYNYSRNQDVLGKPFPYSVSFNPQAYGYNPGEALNFGIYNTVLGFTFYMGDGLNPLNADSTAHDIVTDLGGGRFLVGFEDINGGGDCDFNDNMFIFSGGILSTGGGGGTPTNVAPQATISQPATGSLSQTAGATNLVAPFTDANPGDTHICSVDWNDGSAPVVGVVNENSGSGTCSASKNYAKAGVYTITVTVTDNGGLSGTATTMLIVYDPSAGFVTGGGWINSPVGALIGNPNVYGKANFGFVSKYEKGANIPTGQTEFQFSTGNFNFHSEAYQWLVVSGCKAQYKGTGTVNQTTGYGFLLTATDGDACANKVQDKFRIKVWQLSNGAIVYDNNVNAADTLDNAMDISGGSIVIKK